VARNPLRNGLVTPRARKAASRGLRGPRLGCVGAPADADNGDGDQRQARNVITI
jgi:hypothetical protein